MALILPMQNLPSFTEEISIDNIPYILKFNFNSRGIFWTISFYDREETSLVVGIKLVLGYELLKQYIDRGLPEGEMYVVDPTGNYEKPVREDFINDRLQLIYLSEEDLIEN